MDTFTEKLNAADEVQHPVEGEWHYPDLIAAGFVAETKVGKGFVRGYKYIHPCGVEVKCNTGANADYWCSTEVGDIPAAGGYWGSLKPYLSEYFKKG